MGRYAHQIAHAEVFQNIERYGGDTSNASLPRLRSAVPVGTSNGIQTATSDAFLDFTRGILRHIYWIYRR